MCGHGVLQIQAVQSRPLENGSSLYRAHHEGEYGEHEEDNEEDLRNRSRCARDAAKAEGGGDESENEEDKRPTKHRQLLFTETAIETPDINAAVHARFRVLRRASEDSDQLMCAMLEP